VTRFSPPRFVLLTLTSVAIAIVVTFGPAEKTLGTHVRLVYLHGAWVWGSLAAFIASGLAGLAGLACQNARLNLWSRALGRTGLVFWISYLPISVWAMQANWNGLFLAEPRWSMAVALAVSGLLLQLGLTFIENPAWASIANLGFIVALFVILRTTQNVMHPPAPILNSHFSHIQLYFSGLLLLVLLLVCQIARWWLQLEDIAAGDQSS
jgi:hypothetical protein